MNFLQDPKYRSIKVLFLIALIIVSGISIYSSLTNIIYNSEQASVIGATKAIPATPFSLKHATFKNVPGSSVISTGTTTCNFAYHKPGQTVISYISGTKVFDSVGNFVGCASTPNNDGSHSGNGNSHGNLFYPKSSSSLVSYSSTYTINYSGNTCSVSDSDQPGSSPATGTAIVEGGNNPPPQKLGCSVPLGGANMGGTNLGIIYFIAAPAPSTGMNGLQGMQGLQGF